VDFDPDEGQKYLEGVDYPASKEALLSAAEDNGAPSERIQDFIGAWLTTPPSSRALT
jgi:uncharacterized protein DUF2795